MKLGVGRIRELNTDTATDQEVLDREEEEEAEAKMRARQNNRFGGRGGRFDFQNGRSGRDRDSSRRGFDRRGVDAMAVATVVVVVVILEAVRDA